MTVDKKAWTHRRQIQIEDVLTIEELLAEIAETVRSVVCIYPQTLQSCSLSSQYEDTVVLKCRLTSECIG